MTQEDRELLLKDLCTRLPYGTIILHEGWNYEWDDSISTWERVVGMDDEFVYTKVIDTKTGEEYREDKWPISTFDDKPYLRPMSSMTKEEENEYFLITERFYDVYTTNDTPAYTGERMVFVDDVEELIDFYNAHHFDYRGLIKKGLAIEVTPENNPYKN